ncbi:sugar phosphate isomerase/epimerase family protein [Paenibacillus crassostreae]|uniref:Sugar phosphate isomerase n=1 Tax=Paenibacillus crassostreae TaxID=1763538 RepID=A0A162KUX9_9BACL|nr:sugar phosphate isomerase/epimerase [Paenibacillus crassostreae]AOZ91498.1 sugar phosphate isomerase [Paenibacillus crassostreae]OAB74343.1 sugar phosphate isomerase [Paenibacillus crassostreae]
MLQLGLQLYTVRDQMEQDFEGTLKKVAELGYKGVEFHDFFGRSSSEVKKLLDENGLIAIGTHTQYVDMLANLDAIITYNKEIGNKYIIVPYLSEEQRKWDEVFANLKVLGEKCKEQDMVLLYHNHDFEFTESYGDKTVFDAMYEEVPASQLEVEMDTCWVHFAGFDPVEYVHNYAGRLPIVHWKDVKRQVDGSALTVELGHGEVDLAAIAEAADQVGAEWIVVEQDICQNPPLESIATSMAWVKKFVQNGGPINV